MNTRSAYTGTVSRGRRWQSLIIAFVVMTVGVQVGHAQGVQPRSIQLEDTVPPIPQVSTTPWNPEQSGWKGRMVVGEFLTGIFCMPCQYHEEAFNALLRRYPTTAFISLAYHVEVNAPLGDPADSNQIHIFCWYEHGWDRVCPGLLKKDGMDDWIDGTSTPYVSEHDSAAQLLYETMRPVVDAELRRPPEAFFHVRATVRRGQVLTRVTVDSITGRHTQVFLRLLLVEDTVTLGSPQIEEHGALPDPVTKVSRPVVRPLRREYHMVVRAYAHLPGLALGVPVRAGSTQQYTFDVAAIQQRHLRYHQIAAQLAAHTPLQESDQRFLQRFMDADWSKAYTDVMGMFTDQRDWEINPMRLHIVAFVQDAHTGEVLQTVMVPVDSRTLVLPEHAAHARVSSVSPSIPGVPNRPELVAVVPFVTKGYESGTAATRVPIMAEVDGHSGLFILDLGDPGLDLNRRFLRPSARGGVDTVRDTTQLQLAGEPDKVHVTMRFGTLVDTFVAPVAEGEDPKRGRLNARLNYHLQHGPDYGPDLGYLGLAPLEPFETILDYTHRRVVFIRLDKAGRRLVTVPAYTPIWSAPLIDIRVYDADAWWGARVFLAGDVTDSVFFDTGAPGNQLVAATAAKVANHVMEDVLDSLRIAGRQFGPIQMLNEEVPPLNILGYPFLSHLGVVGFNHRTHQLLLYTVSHP